MPQANMPELAKTAVLHLLPMGQWLKSPPHLKDDIHCKIKSEESLFKDVYICECIYVCVCRVYTGIMLVS